MNAAARRPIRQSLALAALALAGLTGHAAEPPAEARVPILVYHRFGPTVADSMTVRTATFESQLRVLGEKHIAVVPLRDFVAWRLGEASAPPPRSVIITADDGHRSVYSDMAPLVKRLRIPVTLFIYPSAISNASYAMTWPQLEELQQTGLFDIQSHTYWHPNFAQEKRRLPAAEYDALVRTQLARSKSVLEQKLGKPVDLLAWPFGIHDDELAAYARRAGYIAAFTLERRPARASDDLLALPRFLVGDGDRGAAFERMVGARAK